MLALGRQLGSGSAYATISELPQLARIPQEVPFNGALMVLNSGYLGYIRGYLGGLGRV